MASCLRRNEVEVVSARMVSLAPMWLEGPGWRSLDIANSVYSFIILCRLQ